jgi:hypothetical protein
VVSIAGALRSENFFVQTFAGNDFSTLASALTDPGRNSAQFAISNFFTTPNGAPANVAGLFVEYAPVGPRTFAVFGHNGYVEKFARASIAETRVGMAAAKYVAPVMGVKLLYDAGTFAAGTIACMGG